MHKQNNFFGIFVTTVVLSVLFLSSCASKKDVVYFQNTGSFETVIDNNSFTPKFKVDDLVSIHVSTLNSEASAPFNLYRGSSENGMRPEQVDYLIDQSGEIDFPVIGKIKIAGLSSEEIRVLLREELSDYLKNPIINIRIKNFTVTILGQVNRPGTYAVKGERITVFEALGLAGDLNVKGVRQNVLVVRDFGGTKVSTRIDITKKEVMSSPVFYLTQNDLVYVEPNKSAITSSSLDGRAGLLVSIASIIISSSLLIYLSNKN